MIFCQTATRFLPKSEIGCFGKIIDKRFSYLHLKVKAIQHVKNVKVI